jgi:hypothetical protein
MTRISPDEVFIGLTAIIIIAALFGGWIVGFQMRRTVRRILGRKTGDRDLASISTWMQVDEATEKYHQIRPYTDKATDQAASPPAMRDSWRPVRILGAIALIFFTLYVEHLISPGSAWDTDDGHRLTDLPGILGVVFIYYEWKKSHQVRPYTAMAADQPASPATIRDPRSPSRILAAIALIFFSLYLRHLISPGSAWDTYQGHRLTDLPAVFGIVFLYHELKMWKRISP